MEMRYIWLLLLVVCVDGSECLSVRVLMCGRGVLLKAASLGNVSCAFP